MTKEAKNNGNTNKKEMFRGPIKTLHLTTEQRLTITAKGRVKVSGKFGKVCHDDEKPETVTRKVTVSTADTEKIFNRISRYFAKEHEEFFVCDGGTWDLKLTNTEGEVFSFSESSHYDHKSELSKISKLIRKITGLKCIMGFDEDTETELTREELERMKFLEDSGIYTQNELEGIEKGLIKNIRIEEDENTGDKHICYCFDNGGVYRDISLGATPNGGDYADACYYDEKFNRTSREKAFCIDIHEKRFDGEIVGTTWGLCK